MYCCPNEIRRIRKKLRKEGCYILKMVKNIPFGLERKRE